MSVESQAEEGALRTHKPNPDDDVWIEATIWPNDIPFTVRVGVCTTWAGAWSSHMTHLQFLEFLEFLQRVEMEAWPA